MEQIEVEFNYNKELLRDAYRGLLRKNSFIGKKWVMWLAVVIMLLWAIWNVPVDPRYFKDFGLKDLKFPAAFILFFGISYWLLLYRIPNKIADNLLKSPSFQRTTKWVITEVKINIITSDTTSEVQWSYFEKAVFNKKFIFLYANHLMHILPVDCFKGNDLDLFKSLIRKHIAKVEE